LFTAALLLHWAMAMFEEKKRNAMILVILFMSVEFGFQKIIGLIFG
jgi:hypothetical protein